MTTAAPGDMIRLRYGGNGHARGFDVGGEPGTVTVYWKGAPELEITDIKEFTPQNALQSAGFAANSFAYPADPSITTPTQGLVDKGNWMELKLPTTMQPGRHMMTWVWYYENAPQWSTCFDVMIQGSPGAAPAALPAAPAAQASPPAPASPAPAAPAPPPPSPAVEEAVVNAKRSHPRDFA